MLVNTSTLKSHYLSAQSVNSLIEEAIRISTTEASALAAYDGGFREYSSEADITKAAEAARANIAEQCRALIKDAQERSNAYLTAVFELKPKVASELAPILSVRLSDADLRQLAKQHDDYTALRLISSCEGEFSAKLAKNLDQYREAVGSELTKCLRLASRAVTKTPKETAIFTARSAWANGEAIELTMQRIDQLNADLDAFIAGSEAAQKPASGLMGALMSYE